MGNAAPQAPIGGSMQDLVNVQGNGVRYLGLLVNALKAAFHLNSAAPVRLRRVGAPTRCLPIRWVSLQQHCRMVQ